MSKNINVNPAHYKVAGRERQGEDIAQHLQKQAFGEQRAAVERWQARQGQGTPGWEDPAQPLADPRPAKPRKRRTAARRKAVRARKPAAASRSRRAKPRSQAAKRRQRAQPRRKVTARRRAR